MVGALDRERDALVAEADQRAEELARLRSGAADKEAAAAELESRLATAQEQAASQAELLAAADADRAALRRKEEAAAVQEERLRAEALAQEAELAATADDLRKMIRENQVLNEELQRSGEAADQLAHELQHGASQAAYFQQLAKAKDGEKEELLGSYRRQGDEAKALQTSLQQTGLERDRLRAQLAQLETEHAAGQAREELRAEAPPRPAGDAPPRACHCHCHCAQPPPSSPSSTSRPSSVRTSSSPPSSAPSRARRTPKAPSARRHTRSSPR